MDIIYEVEIRRKILKFDALIVSIFMIRTVKILTHLFDKYQSVICIVAFYISVYYLRLTSVKKVRLFVD